MSAVMNQAIFNQVYTHLLTQNEKCEDENGCAYRNEQGLKCAVGCLITDEVYETYNYVEDSDDGYGHIIEMKLNTLEGNSIDAPDVMRAVEDSIDEFSYNDLLDMSHSGSQHSTFRLLDQLQSCHDNASPHNWSNVLAAVAKEFRLEVPDVH